MQVGENPFVLRTKIEMPAVVNFKPEECFQEENDFGLRMIITGRFFENFLRNPEPRTFLPPCEIRAMQPSIDAPLDANIIFYLGRQCGFQLAHLFHILVNEPKKEERILLKEAASFFFLPTPRGNRRAYAVFVPEEQRWKLGVDRLNTPWKCRRIDQVFSYGPEALQS
ncbi:MAG: hypothetical protein M3Q24_02370 [bacterium]|nr:hypothetical protein [bacterium]